MKSASAILTTKLTIVIASFLLASSLRATDVLFSVLNANPASIYNASTSHTIEGSAAGPFDAQGFSFMPSASEQLLQIAIALSSDGGTNSMSVTLNSDSSGLPGAVLETWNVSGLPSGGTCCTLQTLTSNLTIDLFTGTRYWVVALPGANDSFGGWNLDNTGITGTRVIEHDPAGPFSILDTTDELGAFAVIGNGVQVTPPVPEPVSTALVGLGLALLGGFHGHRARPKPHAKLATEARLKPRAD
jgi:hypothetical protein